jgi:hypothetical protein
MAIYRGNGGAGDANNDATINEIQTLLSATQFAKNYAEEWATKAEDSLVSTEAGGNGVDDYSALHYASKAAAYDAAYQAYLAAAELARDEAEISKIAAELAETNATTSAVNAATSETNAAASASVASTSASNASSSATAASASASAASTSETNAAASASVAATSASNAATSETNSAISASNAATSASSASTSATNAATSASNAATSESNAAASATAAANSFDSFDDKYLGEKATAPTVDNDGDPLLTGALYWNTTSNSLFIWDGGAWVAGVTAGSGFLPLTGGTLTGNLTTPSLDVTNNTIVGGNLIINGTVDGRDVAADGTKLDGIEAGATADQTASEILTLIKTVDGTGSGLDADTLDGNDSTYFLASTSYTAADVLSKLLTVDGSGSGLDADTLDGNDGSYYLPAGSYTASDVLTKLQTVDGAGSGLDADTLDGQQGTYYLDYNNLTNVPSVSSFPSGTKMLFQQTAAPTGWTKDTTHDNKALRVVSGTAGSGGSVAFTSAFTSKAVSGSIGNTTAGGTVGNHTLNTTRMPSHNHIYYGYAPTGIGGTTRPSRANTTAASTGAGTSSTGGNGAHNHSFTGTAHNHTFTGTAIDMSVQYVDLIIATKD